MKAYLKCKQTAVPKSFQKGAGVDNGINKAKCFNFVSTLEVLPKSESQTESLV